MSMLELGLTIGYLLAMLGYGRLCYVQGVADRNDSATAPAVRKALRFARRHLADDGSRAGGPRPADTAGFYSGAIVRPAGQRASR